MSEIRDLTWFGSLNLTISIDPELLLASSNVPQGSSAKLTSVSIRVPRESYLVLYLPYIVGRFEPQLRNNVVDYYNGWWFEMEGVPISWNYPIGALFDSLTGLNPAIRSTQFCDNSLNVWNLTLRHGTHLPSSVIPLRAGSEQIREMWMHQWKQACFVMNGSSKLIMSFSKSDTLAFWDAIVRRDLGKFNLIRQRIVPEASSMKSLPLRLHLSLPDIRLVEPVCNTYDNGKETLLSDVLGQEFPEWFNISSVSASLAKAVAQGIDIPVEAPVLALYLQLASFDGFLHVSLCLEGQRES
ncbi:LADA_0C07096g1_1 [Lachancea dasiensis]|uniref:Autophagy protein 5 n=1 Tax=Lachancea dasiensis TaxID=1072105 RepID=A0A1G4IZL1_9SACH|nr:LADA_0C07096g1_1 [Lachancea dasiensis]